MLFLSCTGAYHVYCVTYSNSKIVLSANWHTVTQCTVLFSWLVFIIQVDCHWVVAAIFCLFIKWHIFNVHACTVLYSVYCFEILVYVLYSLQVGAYVDHYFINIAFINHKHQISYFLCSTIVWSLTLISRAESTFLEFPSPGARGVHPSLTQVLP